MSEINVLHPFREGNGRTQREFIRTLSIKYGYDLDWSKINKAVVLQASIRSPYDSSPLANVLEICMDKFDHRSKKKMMTLNVKY